MKAPGGNRNVRWVILHGYSPPVNHSHLKGRSEGNSDNQGVREETLWSPSLADGLCSAVITDHETEKLKMKSTLYSGDDDSAISAAVEVLMKSSLCLH
ncbi:Hypothetical predicted protein [Scomber scombrus]|uniref:Uncharacterized protein n=1 Tax=Scomber scombrus TaxID=13677 RepID=A0AAV1NRC6_SCOSC